MYAALTEFGPLFLLGAFVVAMAAGALVTPLLVGKRRSMQGVKDTPYECGMPAEEAPAGERFGIKFYVVAMLFILFDIEVVFLAGWAWVYRDLLHSAAGLSGKQMAGALLLFVAILEVAHIYAWRRGAFDWAPPRSRRPTAQEAP